MNTVKIIKQGNRKRKYAHRGITILFNKTWTVPDLNAGMIRLIDPACHWRTLNPAPGVHDFSVLDEAFTRLEYRFDPIYCLSRTPQWASARPDEPGSTPHNAGSCAPAATQKYLADHLHAVMDHFPRWRLFQGRNEPWSTNHWTDSVDKLVEEQKTIFTTVKTRNPDAIVIASPDTSDPLRLPRQEEFLLKARDYYDVVSHHFYAPTFHRRAVRVKEVLAMMERVGVADRELWCTEVGVIGGNDTDFENYGDFAKCHIIAAIFAQLEGLGVARTVWFNWNETRVTIDGNAAVAAAWNQMP